jgi:hypothetical protein
MSDRSKDWYLKNKERSGQLTKQWALDNKERKRFLNKRWIQNNRERYNASKYVYRDRLKIAVLSHYAGGKPVCRNCGIDDVDVLCIDHINDDGSKHRKELKISGRTYSGGYSTYAALQMAGCPVGLQVLCANCNLKKEILRKKCIRVANAFYAKRIEVAE